MGYGKRTPFGPNSPEEEQESGARGQESETDDESEPLSGEANGTPEADESEPVEGEEAESTSARYPTKNRGGMGVRDIRTDRNGPVIGVISVHDDDEVLMMTARGKIQRVAVREIRITGRNTHGVRIMSLEEGDTLAAIARVPPEELSETPAEPPVAP